MTQSGAQPRGRALILTAAPVLMLLVAFSAVWMRTAMTMTTTTKTIGGTKKTVYHLDHEDVHNDTTTAVVVNHHVPASATKDSTTRMPQQQRDSELIKESRLARRFGANQKDGSVVMLLCIFFQDLIVMIRHGTSSSTSTRSCP